MFDREKLLGVGAALVFALVAAGLFATSESDAAQGERTETAHEAMCRLVDAAFDAERRYVLSETFLEEVGAARVEASTEDRLAGLFHEPSAAAHVAPWAVSAGIAEAGSDGPRGVRIELLFDHERQPLALGHALRRCAMDVFPTEDLVRPIDTRVMSAESRAFFEVRPKAGVGAATERACRFLVQKRGEFSANDPTWDVLAEMAPEIAWSDDARARWRWSYQVIFECAEA